MENDFDALLEAKQENVRNWVQTQSLEIPPSTNVSRPILFAFASGVRVDQMLIHLLRANLK